MSSMLGEDINYAGPYILASWALTGLAALALIFRYTVKTWIRFALPGVSSPERVWGAEDLLYAIGFNWGLGRHLWFLTDEERRGALKTEFTSQPLAVIAAMLSRSGMMCFLYTCFGSADKHIRMSIIVCMVIQVVVNMVTVIQIIVQCGPNPYRLSDRVDYFHYMWDNIPSDGSVVCQSPSVQTTIGFVQGGFNSTIDLLLTGLSAVQLWRFTIGATDHGPSRRKRFFSRLRKMPKNSRIRRIWQTISLCGPLLLSGIASIVKTYLLKSIGERNDITHNIIPFILWVKIENYSILLATFAPMIRLFLSMVTKSSNGSGGYWSNSRSKHSHQGLELDSQPHTQKKGAVIMSVCGTATDDRFNGDSDSGKGGYKSEYHNLNKAANGVTVRTDIVVRVDSDEASTSRLVI